MKHSNAIIFYRSRRKRPSLLSKALAILITLFILWYAVTWVKVINAAQQERIRILTDPSAPLPEEILTYETAY